MWAFFEVDPDQDDTAICKIQDCQGKSRNFLLEKNQTGKRCWSTKGMWGHLRRYHEQEYASIIFKKQTNGKITKEMKQLEHFS